MYNLFWRYFCCCCCYFLYMYFVFLSWILISNVSISITSEIQGTTGKVTDAVDIKRNIKSIMLNLLQSERREWNPYFLVILEVKSFFYGFWRWNTCFSRDFGGEKLSYIDFFGTTKCIICFACLLFVCCFPNMYFIYTFAVITCIHRS